MKGGARAHVRPGKCLKKKSRGTCVVGLILKKCGPPKKVGSGGWPKTGPSSHCNLCCVAAFAVAGGPYSLTGGGFGGPIETSGVKY